MAGLGERFSPRWWPRRRSWRQWVVHPSWQCCTTLCGWSVPGPWRPWAAVLWERPACWRSERWRPSFSLSWDECSCWYWVIRGWRWSRGWGHWACCLWRRSLLSTLLNVDDADSFFEPKPLSTVLVDAFQRRNVNRPQERVRREKENERHACRWSALRMIAYRVTQNSGRSQWLASAPRNWVWWCLLILSCRTKYRTEGRRRFICHSSTVGRRGASIPASGPFRNTTPEASAFLHRSNTDMVSHWQSGRLPRSFPAGAPTKTKRGRPVTTVSTLIWRSARATRACSRHKAWQASKSHGLDGNLPLCEPPMLRRGNGC